jgi:hypothetical protein
LNFGRDYNSNESPVHLSEVSPNTNMTLQFKFLPTKNQVELILEKIASLVPVVDLNYKSLPLVSKLN